MFKRSFATKHALLQSKSLYPDETPTAWHTVKREPEKVHIHYGDKKVREFTLDYKMKTISQGKEVFYPCRKCNPEHKPTPKNIVLDQIKRFALLLLGNPFISLACTLISRELNKQAIAQGSFAILAGSIVFNLVIWLIVTQGHRGTEAVQTATVTKNKVPGIYWTFPILFLARKQIWDIMFNDSFKRYYAITDRRVGIPCKFSQNKVKGKIIYGK